MADETQKTIWNAPDLGFQKAERKTVLAHGYNLINQHAVSLQKDLFSSVGRFDELQSLVFASSMFASIMSES